MPKIFISYRRADSADAAGRMFDRLVEAFGAGNVFKDVDNIPPGADFAKVIERRLKHCDAVIVVIGRFWLTEHDGDGVPRLHNPSDWVRMEIDHALKIDIRVIPALVGGVSMPSADKLPASLQPLATRNAVVIRADPDFHRDMDRLIEALHEHLEWKKAVGSSLDPPPVVLVSPAPPDKPSSRGRPREPEERRKDHDDVKKPAKVDNTPMIIIGIVVAMGVLMVLFGCCMGVMQGMAGGGGGW